jgi:hypothetical protein
MKTNRNSITKGSLALEQVAKEKNSIGMISAIFSNRRMTHNELAFLPSTFPVLSSEPTVKVHAQEG